MAINRADIKIMVGWTKPPYENKTEEILAHHVVRLAAALTAVLDVVDVLEAEGDYNPYPAIRQALDEVK